MGPVTYGALLVILFIVGAFIFGYFETPGIVLKNSISRFNKGVRTLRKGKASTPGKKNTTAFTVGLSETDLGNKTNNSGDMRVYVHEY